MHAFQNQDKHKGTDEQFISLVSSFGAVKFVLVTDVSVFLQYSLASYYRIHFLTLFQLCGILIFTNSCILLITLDIDSTCYSTVSLFKVGRHNSFFRQLSLIFSGSVTCSGAATLNHVGRLTPWRKTILLLLYFKFLVSRK